jgi:tetratricopeptide (TPR) repeat protein
LNAGQQALTDFNRAIELDPTYDWAIAHRGETYRQSERYEDALADLNRAITLDTSEAEYFVLRGKVNHDTGLATKAAADFLRASQLGAKLQWTDEDGLVAYQEE